MPPLQIKSVHSFIDEILSQGHAAAQYEAAHILTGLENMLKAQSPLNQAMKYAYEKAKEAVSVFLQFTEDHPLICAAIALGMLVILAPWAIEVLGFGELGPIEGTIAAGWQSRYGGYVPLGSLFSIFQRLGMVWGRIRVRSTDDLLPHNLQGR